MLPKIPLDVDCGFLSGFGECLIMTEVPARSLKISQMRRYSKANRYNRISKRCNLSLRMPVVQQKPKE